MAHTYGEGTYGSATGTYANLLGTITVTLGQATETDLAQALTHSKVKVLGQATETDVAQSVGDSRQITQAVETDLAQAITVNPKRRLINQASETDTSQTHTHRKTKTLGQNTETDLAQPITAKKTVKLPYGAPKDVLLDNFNRADMGGAAALSASWTSGVVVSASYGGDLRITSNEVSSGSGNVNTQYQYYSAESYNDPCEVWATVGTAGRELIELLACVQNPNVDNTTNAYSLTYDFSSGTDTLAIWKFVNDALTLKLTVNQDVGAGDSFALRVNAGTLSIWYKAAAGSWTRIGLWVDPSPLTSGYIGLGHQRGSIGPQAGITDFGGGSSLLSELDTPQALTHLKRKTLGQNTETDTAQTVTNNPKRRLLGQATETDTAQSVGDSRAIGQATETDSAQAITRHKTKTLGQVTETDVSQTLTHIKKVTLGIASEGDTAQSITRLASSPARSFDGSGDKVEYSQGSISANFNAAANGGWTFLVLAKPQIGNTLALISLGNNGGGTLASIYLASDGEVRIGTDDPSFNGLSSLHADDNVWQLFAVTQSAANGTPRLHRKVLDGGTWEHSNNTTGTMGTTSGSAPLIGYFGQFRNGGGDFEGLMAMAAHWPRGLSDAQLEQITNTSQSVYDVTGGNPTALWEFDAVTLQDVIGTADEVASTGTTSTTDAFVWTYNVSTSGHNVTVNQASETDTSQAATHFKVKAVGQNTETDTSQAVTHLKRKTLGQTTETDLAQPITAKKTRTLGQNTETDTSQTLTHLKRKTLGLNSETDTAQAITNNPKIRLLGRATESDIAQPISSADELGQTQETDTAQPVTHLKRKILGQVTETDLAQPITHRKVKIVAQATETDTSNSVTRVKSHTLGQATETDLSQAITGHKTKAIGLTAEQDQAISVIFIPPKFIRVNQVEEIDRAISLFRQFGGVITSGPFSGAESGRPDYLVPLANPFSGAKSSRQRSGITSKL